MKLTQHEILSCTPSSCHCLIFSIVHHSFRIVGDGGGSGGGCVVMFLCHCFSYFVCAVVVVELTVKSKIAAADIATATVAARRWRHYISVCLKTSENIFTWAVVFIPYLVIYYYVVLCCAELRSVRQRCIQLLMCLLQLWECHFMNINIAPSLSHILREHTFMYILCSCLCCNWISSTSFSFSRLQLATTNSTIFECICVGASMRTQNILYWSVYMSESLFSHVK